MSASEPCGILVETGRFVVHPWLCDANGHLNTRHYQGFFDDASQHLLALCGHEGMGARGLSVVDARCAMEYKAELGPGDLVVVHSGFKVLGGKSLTSVHEMRSTNAAILFATCEIVSVFFDLDARVSVRMPEDFRANAARLLMSADIATA